MLEKNDSAPHTTVIWLKALTYQLLPGGECSGLPVSKNEIVLRVEGKDKEDCLTKTENFLKEIKDASARSNS